MSDQQKPTTELDDEISLPPSVQKFTTDDAMRRAMHELMGDMATPEFNATLGDTMRQMVSGAGDSTIGGRDKANPLEDGEIAASIFSTLASETGAAGADSIAKTMSMLNKLAVEADNSGPGRYGPSASSDTAQATEDLSEEIIEKMMKEFEEMGQKEDFSSVVDGMMRQLLSKDIMYEPMKSICEKFPEWLAGRTDTLTREEYESYGRMYQCFQRLVFLYETAPDNFPRIMEIMHELQECGSPPLDIIKELAPGLEVNEDGLPVMPNMGPGIPNMPGMPTQGCSIM